ncbi:MAG: hypothetical protein ABIK92_06550 [Pseudomonadota bacterium]
MAYTPELTMKSSSALRRIAWALGVPMTQSIEMVFDYLPQILDRNMVCAACRDKLKCHECSFNDHSKKESTIRN